MVLKSNIITKKNYNIFIKKKEVYYLKIKLNIVYK